MGGSDVTLCLHLVVKKRGNCIIELRKMQQSGQPALKQGKLFIPVPELDAKKEGRVALLS
ncbi:hypothetical protein CF119_09545 [Aeromonas sobria]|nr:hypothetical protein CF119_09545 [Aeromonas sobria]